MAVAICRPDRPDRTAARSLLPELHWLDDRAALTYLHSTISTTRQTVRVPETPVYLDAVLADQQLVGGLAPRLGDQHLRILTVCGFPTATFPGILDELNRLAFPYRWSTRAILLDKVEAARLLRKIRGQWFAKRKSVAAILKEVTRVCSLRSRDDAGICLRRAHRRRMTSRIVPATRAGKNAAIGSNMVGLERRAMAGVPGHLRSG